MTSVYRVYHFFYRYLILRNAFPFASRFNNIKQRMVIYHRQMSIVGNLIDVDLQILEARDW